MPTTADWTRIRELFDAAVELPPADRRAFVERETAGDGAVRSEVESLLASFDLSGSFLEDAGRELVRDALEQGAATLTGMRVGAYEVGRLVGHGGMGDVYEGRRADAEFEKVVALKFLRGGFASEAAVRRLRNGN